MFTIYSGVETDGIWYSLSALTSASFSASIEADGSGFNSYINEGGFLFSGGRFDSGMPIVSVGGADGVEVTVTDAEIDMPVTQTTVWSIQGI